MGAELIEKVVMMALSGSPIAILAVIAYGVFLIWKLSVNHLHHIEKAMTRLADSSERQETTLTKINTGIEVLKDRTR